MKETDVESYLRREAKRRKAMPMKFTSPGLRAVPDRALAFPGGIMVFVEVKAPGEKPRKQQQYRIKQLQDRGFIVRVVDTKEKVDDLMREVDKWRNSDPMITRSTAGSTL